MRPVRTKSKTSGNAKNTASRTTAASASTGASWRPSSVTPSAPARRPAPGHRDRPSGPTRRRPSRRIPHRVEGVAVAGPQERLAVAQPARRIALLGPQHHVVVAVELAGRQPRHPEILEVEPAALDV